jgi:hypothetical protein
MWNIWDELVNILQEFCWEKKSGKKNLRDPRRVFLNEFSTEEQNIVLEFFNENKVLIISDIIKWRGIFSAGWMLVALNVNWESKWVLKSINEAMNIFAQGDVHITDKWSLKIWQITMQRKWWDGWRNTANMLQFKANPVLLFNGK